MKAALARMLAWAAGVYEKLKLFKVNPCDFDAYAPLKPLGSALASLTVQCPCCTGARIVIAAVLAALWPLLTLGALALWVMVAYYSAASDESFDVEDELAQEQRDEDVHR
jgi:hypothetical protein